MSDRVVVYLSVSSIDWLKRYLKPENSSDLLQCNISKSKCSLPEVGLDEQLSKEQTTKAVNVLINNMITASCFVVNQWLIVVSWKQATSSSRPLMYIWIQTIALINKGVQCVGKNARINWKFINIYDINSKRYEIISQ